MKKIVLIISSLLFFLVGCNQEPFQVEAETNIVNLENHKQLDEINDTNNSSVEDYLLLNKNIPEGYWLTQKNFKGSMSNLLIQNPGKIKPKFIENIESESGLELTKYVVTIYTHKETMQEITVIVIDPNNSNLFDNISSTSSSTLLETEEGYIIIIEELSQGRKEFMKQFQSLFEGISEKSFSPESDTFFHKRVNFSSGLFGGGNIINSYVNLEENTVHISLKYLKSPNSKNYGDTLKSEIFIDPKDVNLTTDYGKYCSAKNIRKRLGNSNSFFEGDELIFVFDCINLDLKYGDILKGDIKINVKSNSQENLIMNEGFFKLYVK